MADQKSSVTLQKKISILSQHFYPDIASTGQLLTELAEDLLTYGMSVEVYTGYPAYNKTERPAPAREVYKGIKIKRLFATRLRKSIRTGRILNTLSFFIVVLFNSIFISKESILFFVTNPPYLCLIGLLMKYLRRQKYVILIYDIYPDVPVLLGYLRKNGIIHRVWDMMNKSIYTHADKIIVIGEYMKDTISKKYENSGKDNIQVIHNWADGNLIKPIRKEDNCFTKEHSFIDKTVVLYSGNIGMFQNLEIIIEAAEKLKEHNILFLFIGEGDKKKKLQKMAGKKKLENVRFLPYQKKDDLPYSLTSADISLVTLEKGMEGLGVPSKLYGIMASGRPVIALVSEQCEVADITREAQCGFVVDQEDLEGFIERIVYLHQNPDKAIELGRRAREYFETHFERRKITWEYFDCLSRI